MSLRWGEYPNGFIGFRVGGSYYSTNGVQIRFHSIGGGAGWANRVVTSPSQEVVTEARKFGYNR